jgi:glucose-1-phosphate thymidylyltransferase
MSRKAIILAGGTGARLYPSTISVSKQLMPIYDKPMIYYPLSVLMQADLRDILVITTPRDRDAFEHLLQDGTRWGLNISYATQPHPEGLAQSLIIGEDFLEGHPSAVILGDNLFFGQSFNAAAHRASLSQKGATIFGYHVRTPNAYGVVGFDRDNRVISLEEKPEKPASNYAVTGLYFYDEHASEYAKTIKPSGRGELEITDLNKIYLERGELNVEVLGEGTTWLDTGTHRSLLKASQFVSIIEERQGIRICCPEIIAYRKGWINHAEFTRLAEAQSKSGYGKYLLQIAEQG